MEEISEIIKQLNLVITEEDHVEFQYINIFKNPNKLPINQIHLEEQQLELRKDSIKESVIDKNDLQSCFENKKQIAPALSKCWLPQNVIFHKYQPYNFTNTKDENLEFLSKNKLFLQSLQYLLSCNYHQFWCFILFEPKVAVCLHSFLLNTVPLHQVKHLKKEDTAMYLSVFSQFRRVYERLITFQETESEYMSDSVGLKYLLDTKLLNLPIVTTLILLYHETHLTFVNDLVSLYFNQKSLFRDKEIEEMLDQVVLTLEMIGGQVCGFEPNAVVVPIAVEEKPLVFNSNWVYSVVNYLLNTISTLNVLLKFHKESIPVALARGLPYRLSYTYEKVFFQLYDYTNGRPEEGKSPDFFDIIFEQIARSRSEFVDVFNIFTSFCLDRTLHFSGDALKQQEFIETYLNLMTSALEDEYFICDYHERFDVAVLNEMFASCAEIDHTRTDYIVSCISSLRRHNRLHKTLKADDRSLNKVIDKYANRKKIKQETAVVTVEPPVAPPPVLPTENEIEDSIRLVVETFPHLGDGFALQCLEAYNYNASDVIDAILEENLPPYLIDIPFDTIRIPDEPKPAEPILAYRGKRNDYDDALKLLNDKKDVKQIKTFILDGIQFTNEYDHYDDEYDDRVDETPLPLPDHGTEDLLKFNPNYGDDVVSDTSYSEDEYDENGRNVPSDRRNFCEDPAKVRERMEARRNRGGAKGKAPVAPRNDVVGKPKGQGQEKNVLANRHKKSVNKSSRANHNRKGGAQWKRNRGMMPS